MGQPIALGWAFLALGGVAAALVALGVRMRGHSE